MPHRARRSANKKAEHDSFHGEEAKVNACSGAIGEQQQHLPEAGHASPCVARSSLTISIVLDFSRD
jgi:hypothetical protein